MGGFEPSTSSVTSSRSNQLELRPQVFKVVPPPLGYQLLRFKSLKSAKDSSQTCFLGFLVNSHDWIRLHNGPGGNRTHHTNLAKVGRLLGSCEPIKK